MPRTRQPINLLMRSAAVSHCTDVRKTTTQYPSCRRTGWVWALVATPFFLAACGGTEIEEARATISAQQMEIERLRGYLSAHEEREANLRESFERLAHAVEKVADAFIGVRVSSDLATENSREFAYSDWKNVVPKLTTNLEILREDVADTHVAVRNARAAAGLTTLLFDPAKKR